MRVSIITATYNSSATVADALRSVSRQTYQDIEHIIIDGASVDNTLDLVKEYGSRVKIVVSERDAGVYDAMNKGIGLATGDFIAFLNSDDIYADENVIELVIQKMETEGIDACYADLVYVKYDDTNKIVRYWKSGEFKKANLKNGWIPPHPTFIARRNIYQKYSSFDLNYKLAADYELMTRFISKHSIRMAYIPKVIIKMRLGGMTNKNFKNIYRQNIEILAAAKTNGIPMSLARLGLNKIFRRGFEFISTPNNDPVR